MNFKAPSFESIRRISGITASGITVDSTLSSVDVGGDHEDLDRSWRVIAGGEWTFAQGDIGLRASIERETHTYPAWTQAPAALAGQPATDHVRFETVDFQRAAYLDPSDLDNSMTTFTLGWDRNWRYYLNREVRTSLGLEWTNFDYDPRTAWEHQLWFPTGNFWLEGGGYRAGVDRLTVLGEEQAVRIRPTLEVPVAKNRDVRFAYRGTLSGVELGRSPRYAESVFQIGLDLTRSIRLQSDTRWVKYDAPLLNLDRGWISQFTEATLKITPDIWIAFGMGVDPVVIDPNTNEYAGIGRDVFLNARNASAFFAETNYLSLAPMIRAAEQALQDERRLQIEAMVRF